MKQFAGIEGVRFSGLSGVLLATSLLISAVDCRAQESTSTLVAPALTPEGPEISLNPDESQVIRASAAKATSYKWTLQGNGSISSSTGPATIFTASKEGGTAILVVTAHNDHGASPPTVMTISMLATTYSPLDGLAVPAGWMSGGSDPSSFITLETATTDCHSAPSCLRIKYQKGAGWGGVYWWPHNCGTAGTRAAWKMVSAGSCGVNLHRAGFSIVSRLSFWARGENGGEVIEFKIGGSDVAPKPGRSTGKQNLTPEWKQYEIDLDGVELTEAIGLFGWIAADLDNPHGARFYLDNIQFEGVK